MCITLYNLKSLFQKPGHFLRPARKLKPQLLLQELSGGLSLEDSYPNLYLYRGVMLLAVVLHFKISLRTLFWHPGSS